MTTIVKTKNEALKTAKNELRNLLGVKRLSSSIEVKCYGGARCDCGETSSVKLIGYSGNRNETVVVGYCEICG